MFLSSSPRHLARHRRPLLSTLALVTIAITAGAHAQEQTAKLVKDVNVLKQGLPAGIEWIEPIGTKVVFPMEKIASGKELWVSDGTANGTVLLKDIAAGAASSHPQQGIAFGSGAGAKVAFLAQAPYYAYDGANPPELDLWVTDGTAAGTVRILQSPLPGQLGETFLRAGSPTGVFLEDWSWSENTRDLYFSDGTAAGTRLLNPVVSGSRKFSDPQGYALSGSWCYFRANSNEIWRSDGTDAGTTKVATFTGVTPSLLHVIGDTLYVSVIVQSGVSSALWSCPAAGGTPTRVGPATGTTWKTVASMESSGDKLVFLVLDSANKLSLWASNGTEAGTTRIPITFPGQSTEANTGASLVQWGGAVYFFGNQPNVMTGLWRTDGTAAGTTLLKSIKPPYAVFDSMWPGADGAYYLTSTEKGFQLWRTQGTAATTLAMKGTPYLNTGYQFDPVITPTPSAVYFLSSQETSAEYLVRTKTAKGGKIQLTRPETINGSGVPNHLPGLPPYQMRNGSILDFASTGRGQELWQIDPATGKSKSLYKLSLALKSGGTLGFHGTAPAGELFTRYGGDGVAQLFATDGTSRNTAVLSEVTNAYSFALAQVGTKWFFSPEYSNSALASTLGITDGTLAGTTPVQTADGTKLNRVGNIVSFQGSLYFIAPNSDGKKRELWRSDGTTAGTVRVANTWYGDATETIRNLSAVGNKLYFSIYRNGADYLWQSDGTAAGTVAFSPTSSFFAMNPLMDMGGVAMFQARQTIFDTANWWAITNGVLSRVSALVTDATTTTGAGHPKFAIVGSKLFFSGSPGGNSELWITDGTTANTVRVKDIIPDAEGSRPSDFLAVGNHVYFVASHKDYGRELWRSDGTEAGTVLVADVEPGPTSSSPTGLKVMNGKLYFSAYRRTTGRELYSVEIPQ